ncbi:MAG TPA: L,D-transpeptidase [Kofleriaceae bacterium]|nr:L,D-transpeptidase [Kofleriaceae bacterium]
MRAARPVVLASLVVLGIPGCGGARDEARASERTGRAAAARPEPAPTGTDPEAAAEPAPPPPFPKETRSLELVRTIAVRLEPGDDAKRIGTIGIDTRVAWSRTAHGKGCQKVWVEMRPRGWICADYVKPSTRPPLGREVPVLDRGEVVPGTYGKVTAPSSVTYLLEKPAKPAKPKAGKKKPRDERKGPITSPRQVDEPAPPDKPRLVEGKPLIGSVNVRQYEEVTLEGRRFWRISRRDPEYVLSQAITPHRPSGYAGARLGDDTGRALPIAFVWSRWGGPVRAMYNPQGQGGLNPTPIPARTPVQILETATNKAERPIAYRIGDQRWLAAADVRVFQPAPPPALLLPGERWIDVDLDSQILVAYEGELPVYATLVSSGGPHAPTETGEYRMWLKESEADMKGLNGEDPYSVATVPWTQFFSPEKGLALHTAYWHDQFGTRRSAGCVNLAPRDARWLYFWSDPQVPPGWTMTAGVVEAPGSIVRVRTKDEPNPPPKGYAKKVVEARQQNAPVH